MSPKPKDLAGKKFGKLLVISLAHGGSKRAWNCICDCGKETVSLQSNLTSGKKIECMSCYATGKQRRLTHGMRHTSEYESWAAMKQRCLNPNNPKYPKWGGRGISICSQWINSFETFFSDMGYQPTPTHTLGRIDNDGNYEPSNCRWETPKQQANNRRKAPPRPSHPNSLANLRPRRTKVR